MKFESASAVEHRKQWRRAYHKVWYPKHRESEHARQKRYYAAHRQKVLAKIKLYRLKSKVRRAAWGKEYAKSHRGERRVICRRHRLRHLEAMRARCRGLYPKYKEKNKASAKLRYWNNREKLREQQRQYALKNKHFFSIRSAQRRALKRAATINLNGIIKWMTAVKSKVTARCYYCDKLALTDAIHFDHIIPLSKGGSHSVDNLCVSCGLCNLQKGSKPIAAWVRIGQQELAL